MPLSPRGRFDVLGRPVSPALPFAIHPFLLEEPANVDPRARVGEILMRSRPKDLAGAAAPPNLGELLLRTSRDDRRPDAVNNLDQVDGRPQGTGLPAINALGDTQTGAHAGFGETLLRLNREGRHPDAGSEVGQGQGPTIANDRPSSGMHDIGQPLGARDGSQPLLTSRVGEIPLSMSPEQQAGGVPDRTISPTGPSGDFLVLQTPPTSEANERLETGPLPASDPQLASPIRLIGPAGKFLLDLFGLSKQAPKLPQRLPRRRAPGRKPESPIRRHGPNTIRGDGQGPENTQPTAPEAPSDDTLPSDPGPDGTSSGVQSLDTEPDRPAFFPKKDQLLMPNAVETIPDERFGPGEDFQVYRARIGGSDLEIQIEIERPNKRSNDTRANESRDLVVANFGFSIDDNDQQSLDPNRLMNRNSSAIFGTVHNQMVQLVREEAGQGRPLHIEFEAATPKLEEIYESIVPHIARAFGVEYAIDNHNNDSNSITNLKFTYKFPKNYKLPKQR